MSIELILIIILSLAVIYTQLRITYVRNRSIELIEDWGDDVVALRKDYNSHRGTVSQCIGALNARLEKEEKLYGKEKAMALRKFSLEQSLRTELANKVEWTPWELEDYILNGRKEDPKSELEIIEECISEISLPNGCVMDSRAVQEISRKLYKGLFGDPPQSARKCK
jgi:hypothetical protein